MLKGQLIQMQNINYTFDSIFLDPKYSYLFSELCIKNGLIHRDLLGQKVTLSGHPLNGEKKLLRTLVLYDKIDFESTIYDCTNLIEKGLVSEDSICCSNINPHSIYESNAITIMSTYKDDIINYIKEDFRNNLNALQNPQKIPSYDFWRTIKYSPELVNNVFISKNFSANLDTDYYDLINNLDRLYDFPNGEDGFTNHLVIDQISTLLGIRNNIAYSLISAEKNNSIYLSDFLTGAGNNTSTRPSENIYAFVKTQLPNEVNILPMPQTLDDVWKMRKHPSIISFRKVMSEWNYYINNNDVKAAKKIEKDIISANKALEKLSAIKKFTNSPYVRTGYFIGGFIPVLSYLVNVVSFVEPFVTDSLIKKFSWTHICDK